MALITRCPACQTMFKVAADQFRVAQGWVRCGYCGEVFEAVLNLVPAEAAARQPRPEPEASANFPAPSEAQVPQRFADAALPTLSPSEFAAQSQDALPVQGFVQTPAPGAGEAYDTHSSSTWMEGDLSEAAPAQAPADPVRADATSVLANTEVSFVREARRRAFWKKPLVRVLLGLLSLVLLAALLLQWLLQQKDNLAAMDPRLAPFLQTLCHTLDCEIRPPRHIESVVIDSSNFTKVAPDVYRLSFVLKNTSAARLEIPSLEITLIDAQEQALVRRVLAPQQFGASTNALAAHAELPGMVILKVAGELAPGTPDAPALPVNGYRILAFYP